MFSVIEGKPVSIDKKDPRRQKGKILNLKLDYGGSAYTVKDDIIDLNECIEELKEQGVPENKLKEEASKLAQSKAQFFIDALKQAFPAKEEYMEGCRQAVLKNGYIEIDPLTGRKAFIFFYDEYKALSKKFTSEFWDKYNELKELEVRHEDEDDEYTMPFKTRSELYKMRSMVSKKFRMKGKMERSAQNYPIQGTAASMTKLATIYLFDEIIKRGDCFSVFIVLSVHDELQVEAPEEKGEEYREVLSACMEKAGKKFCKLVPIVAEAAISMYWRK